MQFSGLVSWDSFGFDLAKGDCELFFFFWEVYYSSYCSFRVAVLPALENAALMARLWMDSNFFVLLHPKVNIYFTFSCWWLCFGIFRLVFGSWRGRVLINNNVFHRKLHHLLPRVRQRWAFGKKFFLFGQIVVFIKSTFLFFLIVSRSRRWIFHYIRATIYVNPI